MADDSVRKLRPPPLPQKSENWERKIKSERTLNDFVEDIHLTLLDESEDYRAFLEAVWDSDSVEGSQAIDNVMAAQMLREKAKEIPGHMVAKKRLDTIVKSLGVVLRRYEYSRPERRNTVKGEVVPNPNDQKDNKE